MRQVIYNTTIVTAKSREEVAAAMRRVEYRRPTWGERLAAWIARIFVR